MVVNRRLIVIGMAVLVTLLTGGTGAQTLASNGNPRVLPPQSAPHGKTYSEWSAAWWQWVLGIPADHNPLFDETGADCAVGQSGHVWFLAGTTGGSVTRNCSVPAGRALFFPIINTIDVATDPGDTAELMHHVVVSFVDGIHVDRLSADVDGVPIQGLGAYRAESATFSVLLPDDNVFGLPPGTYGPAAADGFYLMLAPLQPGRHTIHFGGDFPDGSTLDVTDNLLVS